MEEQCELKISIHTKILESSACPRFNKATLNLCATKRYGRRGKASIRNQVSRVERPLLALEIIYHDGFQMEKKLSVFFRLQKHFKWGAIVNGLQRLFVL